MSGFNDHFLDKYFAYRRRYVETVADIAPKRRSLAVASELARLSFMLAGNVLCAGMLWVLTAGAAARAGGVGVWPAVFTLCALVPTLFAAMTVRGLATAARAYGGVRGGAPR